jgi:hypothetical protein
MLLKFGFFFWTYAIAMCFALSRLLLMKQRLMPKRIGEEN